MALSCSRQPLINKPQQLSYRLHLGCWTGSGMGIVEDLLKYFQIPKLEKVRIWLH
jgi:hypothetical protein